MDQCDFPVEKLLVGGWTEREIATSRMLEMLVGNGNLPGAIKRRQGEKEEAARARQREEIDCWVANRAELAVTLTDTLFDYLDAPKGVTTAHLRQTAAQMEAQYREEIDDWKGRAERAEEELHLLKKGRAP